MALRLIAALVVLFLVGAGALYAYSFSLAPVQQPVTKTIPDDRLPR